MSKHDQYARAAERWSETQYGDPHGYLAHRAELVAGLGTPLEPGDSVVDLAFGDGGLGAFLLARGLRYRGVDSTPEMVAEATAAFGESAAFELGDIAAYAPPGPVAATTCFRAIYYAGELPAFFRHVRSYTERKFVFDVSPRRYDVPALVAELRAAGFARVELRPFLRPQRFGVPRPAATLLGLLERSGPPARLLLRYRFTYVVAACCD